MLPLDMSQNPNMLRRTFLQIATAAGASAILPKSSMARTESVGRKLQLARVQISNDLISKTVVGLRPYRPGGYVVRSEKMGAKTIVHHYGHGGCGVTLSWGTAELAADLVMKTGAKQVAILGCGAVGLATARVLQQRGVETTIYAKDLPPNTLSDVAGARWYPFDVFDFKVATPEFIDGVWKASRVAYTAFKKMVGDEYGVFLRPTYMFQNTTLAKTSLLQFDSPMHKQLPGLRALTKAENPTDRKVTRAFETMMIEPAIYLPAIMRDHAKAKGTIVQQEFKSADELQKLKQPVIVNCTGMGAGVLFGDKELTSIKGQLTILQPQKDINYVSLPNGLYMFPRKDGIVLGGTFERGVSTMEPNLEAQARIMKGHADFYASLKA
jgi:D-amino-acid oxidase